MPVPSGKFDMGLFEEILRKSQVISFWSGGVNGGITLSIHNTITLLANRPNKYTTPLKS